MAIRPTDLQNALIYQTQAPAVGQRAEDASRTSQAAAQSQFVAQSDERNEKVAESGNAQGNRIGVKDAPDRDGGGGNKGKKRQRKPGDPFSEEVEEAAGLSDGTAHLVDYSA
jgi:hypothetical protein